MAIIRHKTKIKVADAEVELEGNMDVFQANGKYYFINTAGMFFDSFGMKDLDDDCDCDDSEPN